MRVTNQKEFIINAVPYSRKKVLIIAELGTSHGADKVKAKELIDAAGEAGADCIKFQIVYADEILHPNTGEVVLPGGKIRLYDRFKQLETDPAFYAELKEYVEKRGLLFLATAFGPRSADELKALKPLAAKAASPELNYTRLLYALAAYQAPLFLSTGVSRLSDIEAALDITGTEGVCLLHCVTAYPAPETEYNLRLLPNLGALFGVSVGISDHSRDPELVPALAVAMGAVAVEKHFCLSRDDPGLDDPIALPPKDFARMAEAVRRASGLASGDMVETLAKERGRALVEAVLGDGVKRFAPSEAANYERTNRSIHALHDIKPGEILLPGDLAVLRTEKILRPGLPPSWESRLYGRRARNFIPAGQGIRFEDI
ncbi:MAG: N-acetylneuraminate synthase family protein [Spirochaetaceae bacterium]|jgi:sialic acid synthase SpsE|nr:N-acetylneuraminate synthase family protein [Spirochaetaceae bacterium]